jgi:ABC-type transport system involved in multi-copper enzyme maturation permease subunit
MHAFLPILSQVAATPEPTHGATGWLIVAAIVLIGLVALGWRDLRRLSFTRIWAIGGVCFAESIRRRILLVTPLAILGVIIVTQFQNSMDEQDAVRQTLKFCLFATGLVLVLTTIILACTNIPREIETKVIFTIVTKPTSRLEIVLGKIVGFARVSATVLAIMGLFTWSYVEFRAWRMEGFISQRLSGPLAIPPSDRALLEHNQATGLLGARSLVSPQSVAIFAVDPALSGNDRWIFGAQNQQCVVRYNLDAAQQWAASQRGIYVSAAVKWQKYKDVAPPEIRASSSGFSLTPSNGHAPFADAGLHPPTVLLELLDENLLSMTGVSLFVAPLPVNTKEARVASEIPLSDDGAQAATVTAYMPPGGVGELLKHPYFYAKIGGQSEGFRYAVDASHPITLTIPANRPNDDRPTTNQLITVPPDLDADGQPIIVYRGQTALFGQQIPGGNADEEAKLPLAIYTFHHAMGRADENGRVSMELTSPIDRVDAKVSEQDDPTRVDVIVRDSDHPELQFTISPLLVENRRTAFFDVPANVVASGNFQVVFRDRTAGHFLGLLDDSLRLVTDRQGFTWNLFKSLLILWMLGLLVVTISIFSSTFVSWPIAVVLTAVILLGHWVVITLGEQNSVALGRSITRDFFASATGAQVQFVDISVERLTTMINALASVLPDVAQFDATGELEKGQIVAISTMADGACVLVEFGAPLAVLAYLLLRIKEVAP